MPHHNDRPFNAESVDNQEVPPSILPNLVWVNCSDDAVRMHCSWFPTGINSLLVHYAGSSTVVAELPFHLSAKEQAVVQDLGSSQPAGAIIRGLPFRPADEFKKHYGHQGPSMRSRTDRAPVSHGWTASVAYHSRDPINSAIPAQMNDGNPDLYSSHSSAEADSYQERKFGTYDRETIMTEAIILEIERLKREREDETQSIASMTTESGLSKRARRSSS